jgi:hypothetical protein
MAEANFLHKGITRRAALSPPAAPPRFTRYFITPLPP